MPPQPPLAPPSKEEAWKKALAELIQAVTELVRITTKKIRETK